MAKRLELCDVHSFFTSANLRHQTTVLNADVPNCYTMLKVVSIRLLTIASSIQYRAPRDLISLWDLIFDKYSLEFCCLLLQNI